MSFFALPAALGGSVLDLWLENSDRRSLDIACGPSVRREYLELVRNVIIRSAPFLYYSSSKNFLSWLISRRVSIFSLELSTDQIEDLEFDEDLHFQVHELIVSGSTPSRCHGFQHSSSLQLFVRSCCNISRLELVGIRRLNVVGQVLEAFAGHPHTFLRSLVIEDCECSLLVSKSVRTLVRCCGESLHDLSMSCVELKEGDLEALATHCHRLTTLRLCITHVVDASALCTVLCGNPMLHTLALTMVPSSAALELGWSESHVLTTTPLLDILSLAPHITSVDIHWAVFPFPWLSSRQPAVAVDLPALLKGCPQLRRVHLDPLVTVERHAGRACVRLNRPWPRWEGMFEALADCLSLELELTHGVPCDGPLLTRLTACLPVNSLCSFTAQRMLRMPEGPFGEFCAKFASSLEELTLRTDRDDGLRGLSMLHGVVRLKVAESSLWAPTLESELCELLTSSATRLQRLDLEGSFGVTDVLFEALIAAPGGLLEVHLGDTSITLDGVLDLIELAPHSGIETLLVPPRVLRGLVEVATPELGWDWLTRVHAAKAPALPHLRVRDFESPREV